MKVHGKRIKSMALDLLPTLLVKDIKGIGKMIK
jgi:hypothetical protein